MKELKLRNIEKAAEKSLENYILIQHRIERQTDKEGYTDELIKKQNLLNKINYYIKDLARTVSREIGKIEEIIEKENRFPSEEVIEELNNHVKGKDHFGNEYENKYNLKQTSYSEGKATYEYQIEDQTFILKVDKKGNMNVGKHIIYSTYELDKKLEEVMKK